MDGIPCTTVARTLLDLADATDRRTLERASDQAEVLGILDLPAAHELLSRAPGHRGARLLGEVLARQRRDLELTRSELEERFLAICAGAGVPRPRVNAWLELDGGGIEVDFLWSAPRLIAETDGHAFHGTRAAFEDDRRRDQRLLLAGWRVVRFTWRQIDRDPQGVGGTLRALLGEAA